LNEVTGSLSAAYKGNCYCEGLLAILYHCYGNGIFYLDLDGGIV